MTNYAITLHCGGGEGDCYRLKRAGRTVAEALRLTTGRWGVFCPESGRRLSRNSYAEPQDAAIELSLRLIAEERETR